MTSSPHFSVIMPLYNKAPYVRKAIESVLGQTYSDWELVVVDDGSNDNSAGIAQQTINGYANCRLIHQENSGVSMARNNGVDLSHGDYICFLDADDWWEPTFLEEMAGLIDEFPDAGIYGTNYTIVNENKRKTRVAPVGVPEGFEKGYINYCQAYSKNMGMPLWPGSVCIPRDVFVEMGGFPKGISLGEDFILWIHIALKYKVAFFNKPLSNYNQDIALSDRAVGRLHAPECHMLWNLKDLEPVEKVNSDYKELIDKLRVTGLMSYYISKQHHEKAISELSKVDWDMQSNSTRLEYRKPRFVLQATKHLMGWGSIIKTIIKRAF